MKFSIFSITVVFASFVAATPLLAPRAPVPPHFLLSAVDSTELNHLYMQHVPEVGYPGYFRFGWFTEGSIEQALQFLLNPSSPGPVFAVHRGNYQMVLQATTSPEPGIPVKTYRVLLVDRAKTALVGLVPTSRFVIDRHIFQYRSETVYGDWWACELRPGHIELYLSSYPLEECGTFDPIYLEDIPTQ